MGISGGLPTSKDGGMTRDQWQRLMPRSQSVDAVNTTTKGTVRSLVWTTQAQDPNLSDGKYLFLDYYFITINALAFFYGCRSKAVWDGRGFETGGREREESGRHFV